jgi:hypothetical protein
MSAMTNISVRKADVPTYLWTSEFFLSLNDEDDAEITIASSSLKVESAITSYAELEHQLNTLRFWGSDALPSTLISYALSATDDERLAAQAAYSELEGFTLLVDIASTSTGNKMVKAFEFGNVDILAYLHNTGVPWNENSILVAAEHGHLRCLQYAHEHGCPWDKWTTYQASLHGHFDCLKYACENECVCDRETCAAAAAAGRLDMLIYLRERGVPWDKETTRRAAASGRLDCLKYAYENGCPWSVNLINTAAERGQLECLKYAVENGLSIGDQGCRCAARKGRLECLHYLHEQGAVLDDEVMEACVGSGSVACLQYLLQHDCPQPSSMLRLATCEEDVQMVKAVRRLGFEWEEQAAVNAAYYGRLEVLQYAFEDGAPRSARVSAAAAGQGKMDCLRCAHEYGCEVVSDDVMIAAAIGRQVDAVQYIYESGYNWQADSMYSAVLGRSVEVLQYMHEHGCPVAVEKIVSALSGAHLSMLRYVREVMHIEIPRTITCYDREAKEYVAMHGL